MELQQIGGDRSPNSVFCLVEMGEGCLEENDK
jgi:hypothetical protein